MAGAKGRSGGARPGAGRPKKPPATTTTRDPLEFLLGVMRGEIDANDGQIRAATVAAQYIHPKRGEGGKKDERGAAAKEAAKGKYAPMKAPTLAVVPRGDR